MGPSSFNIQLHAVAFPGLWLGRNRETGNKFRDNIPPPNRTLDN